VIKDLFGGPAPTSVANLTEAQLIAQEGARIELQNGTLTPGLAQRTGEELKKLGYAVVSFTNADRSDYATSVIIDYSGKTATVSLLAQRFNVVAQNIRRDTDNPGNVDVRLILGQDYARTVQ
jgi:hypothetical protein